MERRWHLPRAELLCPPNAVLCFGEGSRASHPPWISWIEAELTCSNINIQLHVEHPGVCETPHSITLSPRDASCDHGSWRPGRMHKGVPDDSKYIWLGKETLPLAHLWHLHYRHISVNMKLKLGLTLHNNYCSWRSMDSNCILFNIISARTCICRHLVSYSGGTEHPCFVLGDFLYIQLPLVTVKPPCNCFGCQRVDCFITLSWQARRNIE